MDFQIQCGELKKALNIVIGSVAKNSAMPILQNILFELEAVNVAEGGLMLTGTNLETTTRHKVEVSTEDKFSFLVEVNLLTSLLALLNNNQILSFELTEKKKLQFRSREGVYKLSTLGAKEFPETPKFNKEGEVTISGKKLKEAIGFVDYACDEKDMRPAFTGICIEKDAAGKISFVATDSRKLAKFTTEQSVEKDISIIIPQKATDILQNILPDEDVTINFNKSFMQICFSKTIFLTRLISAKFPNYRTIIPTDNNYIFTVDRKELLTNVKNLKKLTTFFKMVFYFRQDRLTLSVINEGGDKQEVQLECKGSDEIEIAFNPGYLIEMLSSIKENEIKFEMSAPSEAVLINSNDYTLSLVMPVRIGDY